MLVAVVELTFIASETSIVTKMRFNFEASDHTALDGEWEGADLPTDELAMIYFGFKDGVWEFRKSHEQVKSAIWMFDSTEANMVSVLWRDPQKMAAALWYNSRPPFATGEQGDGTKGDWPHIPLKWKVITV